MLHVDEHPVITRFWTFTTAVQKLLLILLLKLPLDVVFTVRASAQKKQQTRLTRLKTYLTKPIAAADLRVACYCLRVTTEITSMVSVQRQGTGAVLRSLAQGEPQQRAGLLVAQQLEVLIEQEFVSMKATMLLLLI